MDTGPHIFHTPDIELKNFWKKNFKDLLVEGKFYCKNVKGKNFEEYYDYPFSIEALNKFQPKVKNKIKKELKLCKNPETRRKAKNYKEYVDALIGPTLRKMFFEKYPKKIWGIDTNKMTPDWAPNRIKFRKKLNHFIMRNMLLLENMELDVFMIVSKKKFLILEENLNLKKL